MKTKLHSMLFTLMIISLGFISRAQTPFYSFSQYTSAYVELPSPISVNGSTVWNYSGSTPSAYFPLDIATLVSYFEVFGDMNNNMRIWGGVLQFYHSGFQQLYYLNAFGFFSPDGMKDKGTSSTLSPISYQVVGASPNRILKVQWKNAGHAAASADFINVQIWLYETSNVIEMHYGSSSITNAGTTQLGIGIGHVYVPTSNPLEDDFLQNSPSNPVLSMSASPFYGIPADGTVYKFAPGGAAVNEINFDSFFSVYPSPSSGVFQITSEQLQITNIEIVNELGDIVSQMTVNKKQETLDLSAQPNGIYFLHIKTDQGTANKKLIIQK